MRPSRPFACSIAILLLSVAAVEAADLRFAHGLYKDKRYGLAADEYKSFLAANADDPKADEARYYLGESLVQLRRFADAAAAYESVTKSAGDHRKPSLYRAGTLRHRLGDLAKAEKSLEQFVIEFPEDGNSPNAWLILAECRLAAKRTTDAEAAVRKARLVVDKGSKWWGKLQLVEAELLTANGKGGDAVEVLRELSESSDPSAADAASRMGAALFTAKKFAEAAASFDRTAETSKDAKVSTQATYNAGLCFLELKQWTRAAERFAPIFAAPIPDADPEGELLIAQAGQALVQARIGKDDLATAKADIENALRKFGRTAHAVWFKALGAELSLREGRHADAATELKMLLREELPPADRSRVLIAACRAAAATADATWATELLAGLPADISSEQRREAESAIAHGQWKTVEDIESLKEKLSDRAASETMEYRIAAADFEAGRAEKSVARLRPLASRPGVDPDLKAMASYLLGGALTQANQWEEGLVHLDRYFAGTSSAVDEQSLTAAKWWAKCVTWLSDADADAKKRIELLARRNASPPFIETIAAAIAAERRSELALWLLQKHPSPGSKTAAAIEARCLIDLKRPREAIERLPNPTTPEEKYLAGVAAVLLESPQRIAEGRKLLEEIADSEPPSPWSLDATLRLARLAKSPTEAAEAEQRLKKLAASAKGADRRRVRLETAFLAAEQGRSLQAAAELQSFIDEEKNSPEALDAALRLAEIYEGRGETRQAEAVIATAEKMDVGAEATGSLLFRRASMAYRKKDWKRADALLAEFLAKHPNETARTDAALMHGETAMELQKFDDAVRRFSTLKDDPNQEVRQAARLRLAQALVGGRKYDEAERIADDILRSEGQPAPRIREAEFVRGRALMSKAKFTDARTAFEKAADGEESELSSKSRFMIGETYFHQKKWDAARKEYLKVAVLGTQDEWKAAALLQVGKCHEQLGDRIAAAEDYRRIVDQHPDAPAAKHARERLKEIASGARNPSGNPVKE